MIESKYWDQLQSRVSKELNGLDECHRRGLWCHGFVPKTYSLESKPALVSGWVWIGIGPREHEKWTFTLVLPQPAAERESIPWDDLLPPNEVTAWLTVDLPGRRMAIQPGVAVPIAS